MGVAVADGAGAQKKKEKKEPKAHDQFTGVRMSR